MVRGAGHAKTCRHTLGTANGTFTSSRKTNRKTYVYVASGTTKSDNVTLQAR